MKAKILNANSVKNEENKRYWKKFIGKIYPIMKKVRNGVILDMFPDIKFSNTNRLRYWTNSEIQIIGKEKLKKGE